MAGLAGVIRELETFAKSETSKYAERAKVACVKTTRKIREEIIELWFNDCNPYSTLPAQRYEPKVKGLGSKTITIVTRNYMETGAFAPDTSKAEAWVERHGAIMEPSEWIAHLQWDEGFPALPTESSVSSWKNPVPREYGPLKDRVLTDGQWSEFEARVKAQL